MDADSGRVLYEQNADARMLIASTTKIMTALVAIREGNLADTVTVKREATLTEGSSMYLREGEQLTLETLLYGLMLCSGNDAAVAIADHVGGGQAGFVKLMNETARELGMDNTSFANPNGLDDENHYSHRQGHGGAGPRGHGKRDAGADRVHPQHHRRRADHDEPQQAAGLHGRLHRIENRLYPGGWPDPGQLRGTERAAAGGGDPPGRQRLGGPQALYEYGFSTYPAKPGGGFGGGR